MVFEFGGRFSNGFLKNFGKESAFSVAHHDGRSPVAQLTHGESPNTPIDSLKNLADNAKCLEICGVILANDLNDYYGNAQKSEALEILMQLQQELLTAMFSTSTMRK